MIDIFNTEETMSFKQVATQLNVCELTVRRWHKQGLHAVKCGQRTVTNMRAVNEFLNSKRSPKNKQVSSTVDAINTLIK